MLILTRRADESIRIGHNIIITILDVGSSARVGIEAPRDIEVHREEVYRRILNAPPGKPSTHDTGTTALAD